MSEKIINVGDQEFEKIVANDVTPVLIDFWAPWCGPCKAIGPILETLAEKYSGRIIIAKCNIDDNPESPRKYGVKSIPTLMFFKKGELVERITGVTGQNVLESIIDKILSGEKLVSPLIVH